MKTRWLFLVLLFVYPSFVLAADDKGNAEQNINSSIRQVMVFRSGAQVTRQAEVTLSPGRNEILFTGLSSSLRSHTLQLSGSGSFMILSLSHRQDYLGEHPQEAQLQQLTMRRDSLQRLIEDNETTASVLDRELTILLSNTTLKGEGQNLSTDELKLAMEFFHQKLTDLETQKLQLKRELEKLREELNRIRSQISELNGNTSQNRSVVEAVLQTGSAERASLTLTYFVNDASWSPSYDLRAGDIDSPVSLSYKANIYQSTGVDWNDVALTVTSAVPDQGGVLPELQPWYLQFYVPQPNTMNLDTKLKMERPSAAREVVVTGYNQVPIRKIQNQTSFSYQIELPYSVPSGGKPLTVEINRDDIPAGFRYHTVPKLHNRAYLTARVSDWDHYNLLQGEASLFFENTYVGKSVINPRSVGDTLSFSLGRDESIVTERRKLKEFEEKNFFGNKARESFAWEISVRNTKDKPISIEVEDQIPVSQHEDIKVSLKEASGAIHNRQNGTLSWMLQMAPGETETLRFEYEVEYPSGRQVSF